MTIYSQRDLKWKGDKMGSGTLGQYGCAVTCISMLRDVDPGQTNKDIKAVNGYQDNLIIWDALDKISRLDFIKRVRVYENDEVAKNLPCLVEVNGAPIGGTTHWVLYIGNQKCWDPWDGTEKPTSSYKPIGYAVVKRLEVPVPAPTPSTIDLGGLQTPLETYGVMEIDTLKSKLLAKDTDIKSKQGEIEVMDARIDDLDLEISRRGLKINETRTIVLGKGWPWVKVKKIKELLG